MNEERVVEVVQIERDAIETLHGAQSQADHLVAEAMQTANLLRKEILEEAQQEAEKIVADGKAAAEDERADILGAAEAEAQQMVARAADHHETAVLLVIDRVTGR